MAQDPKRDERIRDLEPKVPDQQQVKPEDADAVRGGRKSGEGQKEFFP